MHEWRVLVVVLGQAPEVRRWREVDLLHARKPRRLEDAVERHLAVVSRRHRRRVIKLMMFLIFRLSLSNALTTILSGRLA